VSVPGVRLDPLPAYNFLVTIVDSTSSIPTALQVIASAAIGGFSECSGLEMTLQVEEYRAGGVNDKVLKFPTRVNWSNLRLRRGVGLTDSLWNWHNDYVQGRGKRRDGAIILQNELHIPLKVWIFRRGLPVKWTGPALNANQNQVAIEELEIAHEGLTLASLGTAVGV
jgi:phage tail-like protein